MKIASGRLEFHSIGGYDNDYIDPIDIERLVVEAMDKFMPNIAYQLTTIPHTVITFHIPEEDLLYMTLRDGFNLVTMNATIEHFLLEELCDRNLIWLTEDE